MAATRHPAKRFSPSARVLNARAAIHFTAKVAAVIDLAGIGKRQSCEYLLESILYPNKVIAPGFENVTLVLKNGNEIAGTVKSETAKELPWNVSEVMARCKRFPKSRL